MATGFNTMIKHRTDIGNLRLLGGRLCIDFVNTVEDRAGPKPEEFLTSYGDLASWGKHVDLLDESTADRLQQQAALDPEGADRAMARAVRFREVLYRLLQAIANGSQPNPADVGRLQRIYHTSTAKMALRSDGRRVNWDQPVDELHLEQVIWPIAFSALDLLTNADLERLKMCANPYGCGWFFYDASKNRSRRWCSMEGCGSRVKMRQYHARQRRGR